MAVAHEYEMITAWPTGSSTFETDCRNLSAESMPLAVGFHSFFPNPGHPARSGPLTSQPACI